MALTETECLRLITEAMVPGMSAAIIKEGELSDYICCGIRHAQSPDAVDKHTVFEAASLSKSVFAHAVLQLMDQGCISLDVPLSVYLPHYVPGDHRAASITARHVLSHSGGFPNWRSLDVPLKTYFRPGARFSYSGEGFLYLQKAVEAISGEKLHSLAERLVLQPFGMTRSGYIWDWGFEPNRAYPHDAFGRPTLGGKPGEGNAAWSLQTTAADFGRFLIAVLDGSRLRPETAQAWLSPEITVRHPGIQNLAETAEGEVSTGVGWSLGWGLELAEGNFFHWGDNGAFKAFTIGSVQQRNALVCFWNGASGLAIAPELVAAVLPGERPSLAWLDYGRLDRPIRRLLRHACSKGVAAAWPEIETANLKHEDVLWIAQGLAAAGRDEDGLWLRAKLKQQPPTRTVQKS
ncbi:MAG: beta-lactamase family protein [Alphaproteobacteria bacterium]|nr:beta-lactamase family protein [Alphaproteobacteria bacterium]MBV9860788.1 beta-lactamase family protein [Alphaproteobacteria bacterium]